jgi:hypothetical protein
LINFTPLLHFYFSDSARIFGEEKRKQKVLNTSIGIASKGRRRRQQSNNDEENGSDDETSGGDEKQRRFWRRRRNNNGEPAEKNIKWKRQDK